MVSEKKRMASVTVVQNITNNVQNIQVNTLGDSPHISVTPVSQVTGPNSAIVHAHQSGVPSDPYRFPGWPAKWPSPNVLPTSFKPLGFEISQPEMEAAVGSLTAEERTSCARGETLGVARLLVEILKRVHADPKERNVYLNPARSDQALVFIPCAWSAQPLEEAAQSLFARVRTLLEDVERSAERDVHSAVSGARRGCEGKLPQLARASRAQLSAHLENVRRATASGEDWLGTGGEPSDQPAFIGKEHVGHLEGPVLAPPLEQASGVYTAADVSDETAPSQTARALAECARYMLHTRPTNLTVLEVAGVLYAHERESGWVPWEKARAAEAILRRTAWLLRDRLHDIPDSPLVALSPWLGPRLREVLSSPEGREAGGRVLWHYARAASRYYAGLPRVQDPHDRREAARRLLSGEPPLMAPQLSAPAEDLRPLALTEATEGRPLADEDLESLLGFMPSFLPR